jgi:hypothetical protein
VSLPNDGARSWSDTNFRSDETQARFEEPACRAYCHRRRHWGGPVFRLRQGHPERRSRAHTRVRVRRIGDFLYHVRSGRVAPLSSGRRVVRGVCRRIHRSIRRIRYGLVLLVHVGRDRHGRTNCHWRVCGLLAARLSQWISVLAALVVLYGAICWLCARSARWSSGLH